MAHKKRKPKTFRELLEKYLQIKGLDIVIVLDNGQEIELHKNRILDDDFIITFDTQNDEKRISISDIKSVDMYAA